MGTHHRRRKTTSNQNSIINQMRRDSDLDQNKLALQPTFEGTTYTVSMVSQIDFVNVTDSVDPSQG